MNVFLNQKVDHFIKSKFTFFKHNLQEEPLSSPQAAKNAQNAVVKCCIQQQQKQ